MGNSKNKLTHIITNNNTIVAMVWFHPIYGRTIERIENINFVHPVEIYEMNDNGKEKICDVNFIEFISSML
jgi:hypothetical protein